MSIKLLIVDDEAPVFYRESPKLSKVRVRALESLVGMKLDFAADFQTAKEKLKKNRYDFVITDLNIPSDPKTRFTEEDSKKFFAYLKRNFKAGLLREMEGVIGPFYRSEGSRTPDTSIFSWWKDESVIPGTEEGARLRPVLGILVAAECRRRKIPHMVWTHDFDHGTAGTVWVVGCSIVSPSAAGALVRDEARGTSFRRSFGEGAILAFGDKRGLGHWLSAIMVAAYQLKLPHGSIRG